MDILKVEALLSLILFFDFWKYAYTYKCIVSKWREWGSCIGSCEFALRVRNRDVLRPPFPERTKSGVLLSTKECPNLYEIEECLPKECEEVDSESPFTSKPIASLHQHNERSSAGSVRNKNKIANISETRSKISGTSLFRNNFTLRSSNRIKCDENQDESCCRVSRIFCPDGSRPKMLTRWYRLQDETVCRLYNYPYCGSKYEEVEQPKSTEEECIDACFTQAERTILSSLRII